MKHFRYIIIVLISLFAISGCHKPEQTKESDTSNSEVQNTDENKTEENSHIDQPKADLAKGVEKITDNTPKTEQTTSNENDTLDPVPDNEEISDVEMQEVREAMDAFPEMKTTITQVEKPWGSIQRTTLHWYDNEVEIYHEIPIFKDDTPAIKKINDKLMEGNRHFFTKENLSNVWGYVYQHHKHNNDGEKYLNTYTADVTEFSDKYISITLGMQWYMGGVNDYGTSAITFDRSTGEPISLKDFYNKSEDEVRNMVIEAVKSNVDDESLIEWDSLNKKKDFQYYLKDGVPHVTFAKYEIAVGAAGAFDIPLK